MTCNSALISSRIRRSFTLTSIACKARTICQIRAKSALAWFACRSCCHRSKSFCPTIAEGNAVFVEPLTIAQLHGLKRGERFFHVTLAMLHCVGKQHTVAGGFRGGACSMRPDDEGSVAKKARASENGARHEDIDDRLNERMGRGLYQIGHAGMHLAQRELPQLCNGFIGSLTQRHRSMVLVSC